VIDGEIVIANGPGLDFDLLTQRIHPAASRVNKLAAETPASFVAFDLLAVDDESLMAQPFSTRRDRLEQVLASARPPVHITPATDSIDLAHDWFEHFEGAGLDGVVAKSPGLPYQPDQRVMVKVKHERTADCVVAGFRWHKTGGVVGSLLLGLYDDGGTLQHVGVCAAFSLARRKQLVEELEPYRMADGAEHPWSHGDAADGDRRPGAESRWSAGKNLSWVPLRPDLVCEVAYDHMEGDRFRHTAQFRRWRPDRDPSTCTYAQLERPVLFDLAKILA
jgi:ATP-dependent DNA ligase